MLWTRLPCTYNATGAATYEDNRSYTRTAVTAATAFRYCCFYSCSGAAVAQNGARRRSFFYSGAGRSMCCPWTRGSRSGVLAWQTGGTGGAGRRHSPPSPRRPLAPLRTSARISYSFRGP